MKRVAATPFLGVPTASPLGMPVGVVVRTAAAAQDSRARWGHGLINRHVDDLLARLQTPESAQDVDTVRDLGTALISVLLRHRQRGSDLVFEAYEVDIGGET